MSLEEENFVPCFKESLVKRLRSRMPSDSRLDRSGRLFSLLADRARLKILCAFQQGEELCVCDVANVLGTTISTASHHLRKMRDFGLLTHRIDGKMAYYSLADEFAARLAAEVIHSNGASGSA